MTVAYPTLLTMPSADLIYPWTLKDGDSCLTCPFFSQTRRKLSAADDYSTTFDAAFNDCGRGYYSNALQLSEDCMPRPQACKEELGK